MNEETTFAEFFNTKLKERGLTIKKLAEISGISLKHLDALAGSDYDKLPPAPYLRGYLVKLGPLMEFDSQVWWERLKRESTVKSAGGTDSLPKNRFARTPFSWRLPALGFLVLVLIVYGAIRLSHIVGKPDLVVTSPAESRATVTSADFTLQGRLKNGDQLDINGEQVSIADDGSWSKEVMLQGGLNTFQVRAKKYLGRETIVERQVFFEVPPEPELAPTPVISD